MVKQQCVSRNKWCNNVLHTTSEQQTHNKKQYCEQYGQTHNIILNKNIIWAHDITAQLSTMFISDLHSPRHDSFVVDEGHVPHLFQSSPPTTNSSFSITNSAFFQRTYTTNSFYDYPLAITAPPPPNPIIPFSTTALDSYYPSSPHQFSPSHHHKLFNPPAQSTVPTRRLVHIVLWWFHPHNNILSSFFFIPKLFYISSSPKTTTPPMTQQHPFFRHKFMYPPRFSFSHQHDLFMMTLVVQ